MEKKLGSAWTHIIMWGVVAILTAWDIVAVLNTTPGDTESRTILRLAREWHTIPLCFGIIVGHLFWPRQNPGFNLTRDAAKYAILVPLLTMLFIVDFFVKLPLGVMPVLPLVGFFLGHYLWPMNPKSTGS